MHQQPYFLNPNFVPQNAPQNAPQDMPRHMEMNSGNSQPQNLQNLPQKVIPRLMGIFAGIQQQPQNLHRHKEMMNPSFVADCRECQKIMAKQQRELIDRTVCCLKCGKLCKNNAGLSLHIRRVHVQKANITMNTVVTMHQKIEIVDNDVEFIEEKPGRKRSHNNAPGMQREQQVQHLEQKAKCFFASNSECINSEDSGNKCLEIKPVQQSLCESTSKTFFNELIAFVNKFQVEFIMRPSSMKNTNTTDSFKNPVSSDANHKEIDDTPPALSPGNNVEQQIDAGMLYNFIKP